MKSDHPGEVEVFYRIDIGCKDKVFSCLGSKVFWVLQVCVNTCVFLQPLHMTINNQGWMNLIWKPHSWVQNATLRSGKYKDWTQLFLIGWWSLSDWWGMFHLQDRKEWNPILWISRISTQMHEQRNTKWHFYVIGYIKTVSAFSFFSLRSVTTWWEISPDCVVNSSLLMLMFR